MPKTRLNQTHRDILRSFAGQAIKCPVEQKARDRAYAKASEATRRCIEKQFPAADMAVLGRYGVSTVSLQVEGGSPEGGFVRFEFDKQSDAPPRPQVRHSPARVSFDTKATVAVQDYDLAAATLKTAHDKKLVDYKALVTSAKTFEDILDVWPAAAAVAERIKRQQTALVILSADRIAAIRADNAGAELLKQAA